jgi:hypothetical protein
MLHRRCLLELYVWVAMGKDQSCARTLLITDGSFGASALAQVSSADASRRPHRTAYRIPPHRPPC